MKSERIAQAQKAFETGDIKAIKKLHTEKAIRSERHAEGEYLKDFIYGASDGIITIFSIVAGIRGASLSSAMVLVLGFASLFADGLSMAVGNYLGTKSQADYVKRERLREAWEVENYPRGELAELRKILRERGFKGNDQKVALRVISSDKRVWVETMMRDELGIIDQAESPITSAIITFFSFVLAGLIPLLSFVLALFLPGLRENSLILGVAITSASLFMIGASRSLVTAKHWLVAGLEMLILGGAAASVAFLVGHFLATLA